ARTAPASRPVVATEADWPPFCCRTADFGFERLQDMSKGTQLRRGCIGACSRYAFCDQKVSYFWSDGRPPGSNTAPRSSAPMYLPVCGMLCGIRITTPGSFRLVYHAKGINMTKTHRVAAIAAVLFLMSGLLLGAGTIAQAKDGQEGKQQEGKQEDHDGGREKV